MMRRIQTSIFLVVTYLLVTDLVYSQGTPAVLHCSFNGHLDVYSRSERSSPVIAKVKCGDRLFLIEQRFRYPYVRTEDGKDGFILSPNHGQWSIDAEGGPPGDSVATPAGTTGRTGKPLIGPKSAAKSEQSAVTRTLNKPSYASASSAAAPVAAPGSSQSERTPDLTTRTQQQPEVIQRPTSERPALPRQATFVEPDKAPDSTASPVRPSIAEPVGPTSGQPTVLSNSDIVSLVKAHLSADVITALIESSQPNFETTPAALADLKAANVPEAVVWAMLQTSRSKFPK
jgi:hypothetical protein